MATRKQRKSEKPLEDSSQIAYQGIRRMLYNVESCIILKHLN